MFCVRKKYPLSLLFLYWGVPSCLRQLFVIDSSLLAPESQCVKMAIISGNNKPIHRCIIKGANSPWFCWNFPANKPIFLCSDETSLKVFVPWTPSRVDMCALQVLLLLLLLLLLKDLPDYGNLFCIVLSVILKISLNIVHIRRDWKMQMLPAV